MSSKNRYIIRILSFLCAAIAVIMLIVWEKAKLFFLNSIKNSLDFPHIYTIIIAISLLVGLYYTFYFAKYSKSKEIRLLFKIFGPLFDPPANTLAYGIVIASVLKLVKGLFNQFFFDEEYFKEFDFISVSAIALACIPLLIWSVNGLYQYIRVIFIPNGEDIGEVTAKIEDEN